MQQPLSILFFGTQMAIGGAQRLLLDQARWFHAHGHNVTAAFFYDKEGLRPAWEQGLDFPLLTMAQIDARSGRPARVVAMVAGLLRLWRLLRANRFDVIETFTYDSNLLAMPLAWLAGVRVRVATHHGVIEGFPGWIERLHAWLINLGIATVLVSVSRKAMLQAAHAGVRQQRLLVIPNGVSPVPALRPEEPPIREELHIARDSVVLLSVGRLVYQKGHEYLVRAMPRILRDFPRTTVLICGEGSLHATLDEQISQLRLQSAVRLLGNRRDLYRFLRSADVFVHPSRWEGLPVALLEAMDCGLPVVATRVEGVEEVVQNEVEGILVSPEDPDELGTAVVRLLGEPSLRASMGEAAHRRIQERYTVDFMCEKYLQLMVGQQIEQTPY